MNTHSQIVDALRFAIVKPGGGIVGVVDDVLRLCADHSLSLTWKDSECCVRFGASDNVVLALPLRKSVFRAILARVAALCSDKVPDTFSPYRGHGELSAGSAAKCVIHVSWINTTGEQALEVAPAKVNRPVVPPPDSVSRTDQTNEQSLQQS